MQSSPADIAVYARIIGIRHGTYTYCRFPLEMADNPRDSTLVGGGPGLRIPREMADSYTAL